ALAYECRRRREHFLHAGAALGTFVADDDDVSRFDFLAHAGFHTVIFRIESARRPGDSRRLESSDLGDAAFGSEIAFEDREVPVRIERSFPGADHVLI